jgi:D-serine deaminase-like pyridoxal phosphate-dependent protein
MNIVALEQLLDDQIDWRYKGFPVADPPATPRTIATHGWNVLRGDLPLPVMVIREDAVAANIATMTAWCATHDVSLAPHGKTTMSPELFRRQLDAGAWAITVAHAAQARVCAAFGVPRVLIANEVVEPAAVRWIGDAQRAGTEVWLLVDSVAGVERLAAARRADDPPIRVLIELGMDEGRAGARTQEVAEAVALAAVAADGLMLSGVAGWEGHIGGADLNVVAELVDTYLLRMRELVETLAAAGRFADCDEVVVTAGGSAWFDRVAALLRPTIDRPVRLVVRAGCTVSHDDGLYRRLSPFERETIVGEGRLAAALEVWGVVLSLPEPGLAIVGFGKRDVPFDIELPIVRWHARDGVAREAAGLAISALNDQHAFVRGSGAANLAVGDLIGCGISHPCTAFDKWRLLPLINADRTIVGAVHTYF